MRKLFIAASLIIAPIKAFSQFCPSCIANSPTPQNAQMNIGTATIRGTIDASTGTFVWLNATNLSVTNLVGNGSALTNLNASNLASGTVPSARVSGNYSGVTGLGTITSGVWQATPLGTQYGGTGQNFVTVSAGSLVYFSSPGTMATLLPGSPQQLLQTNGSAAPVWTSAPAVSGANLYGIPSSRLVGALPPSIVVSSNSIPYVAGASVLGDIAGNAQNINGTLLQSQIAPGTWPSAYAASSITASGVTPGVYGGPALLAQVNIHSDGRVYAASQFALSVPPSIITAGALPAGVTIPAAQVTAGNLPSNVVASSVAASGVLPGSYGDAARTVTVVPLIDGRLSSVVQQNIALPLSQLNAGTLPGSVLVPAASIQAGSLGSSVIASSLAANGVVAGTYGSATKSMSATIGLDGRITSVTQFTIPGTSSITVTSDKDNAWTHSQTFLSPSSITVQGNILAQNITGTAISASSLNSSGSIVGGSSITGNAFFGDGSHLTGVTATIPGVTNTRFLQDVSSIDSIGWNARTLYGTAANPVASWASGGLVMAANAPIFLSGGAGNIVSASSVSASAFFGDGSGLTNVTAFVAPGSIDTAKLATDAVITSKVLNGAITPAKLSQAYLPLTGGTLTGALTVTGTSITANAFFGDGSHLTGITSGGGSGITFISTSTAGVAISSDVAVEVNTALPVSLKVANHGIGEPAVDVYAKIDGNPAIIKLGYYDLSDILVQNAAIVTNPQVAGTPVTFKHVDTNGGYVQVTDSKVVIGNGGTSGHVDVQAGTITATGSMSATTYFGDGSNLTGISAGSCTLGAGANSVLCQGLGNTSAGAQSNVPGGKNNSAGGDQSMVGGGQNNSASAANSAVLFGDGSTATNLWAISAGRNMHATNIVALALGGQNSTASGILATVLGGEGITASGTGDTVVGGSGGVADGGFGFVAGGQSNATHASYAFASGVNSVASGIASWAGGSNATADVDDCYIWGDNSAAVTCRGILQSYNVKAVGGAYFDAPSVSTFTGTLSIGNGNNIVYYCTGSTAGTFDGNLARNNANAGACAGGTWVATSLKVD